MRLLILTYHYIRSAGGPFPGIHPMTPTEFRAHVEALRASLHAATPEEALAFVTGAEPLPRDAFFLTFDDGLVDHRFVAREILEPMGIRAGFFAPTRPIDEGRSPAVTKLHWLRSETEPTAFAAAMRALLPAPWDAYELSEEEKGKAGRMHIHDEPPVQQLKFMLNFLVPYAAVDEALSRMLAARGIDEADFCARMFLDRDGLRKLVDRGHLVGAHGHDHAPLSAYAEAEQAADLDRCNAVLSSILGAPPTTLSYPYGRADALPSDCAATCRRHGYAAAFTLLPGWNEMGEAAPSALKRITPNELPTWR